MRFLAKWFVLGALLYWGVTILYLGSIGFRSYRDVKSDANAGFSEVAVAFRLTPRSLLYGLLTGLIVAALARLVRGIRAG
jgi:hypothetical protein